MNPEVALRCRLPDGVLAVGHDPLRLTWRVRSSDPVPRQEAYEIEASSTPDFATVLATSGVVPGDEQVAVPAPGPDLQSREMRYLRVRILTAAGWTDWSPSLRVEAGLLAASDWIARPITLPDDPGAERQAPAPILRREFDTATHVVAARLYVTSLGLNRVSINGQPVSTDLLAPGWTAYRHRLLVDTYDVTELIRPGTNAIAAMLGDGWYRGRLGWQLVDDRGRYGSQVALIAQLEVQLADGSAQVIATDPTWQASTGEIRTADLYDGTMTDLRERQAGWELPGFAGVGWRPAIVVPFEVARLEPRIAPPVRVVERIPVEPTPGPAGALRLDGGQNIAGFIRLRVRGSPGDSVTVRHAEVLEPDGALHTRSLRSASATDTYILADDGEVELEPAFTFHGFRYAEIETVATVLHAEFHVISSDTPRRGWFDCSDEMLARLHENVVWSQRDNFVSVPTDCPQRDERLGWTGDAQAFAPTGCVLFDSQAFWMSWLRDLALDQDVVLGVSTVVPDVVLSGQPRYGRAGWADAATIVPWAVYEAYGDRQVLLDQFDSMRSWVDSLAARAGPDGLLGPSMQFGDWLDPDAPENRPWEAKTDPEFLANAFYAQSARLLADAAAVLAEPRIEERYRGLADRVSSRTWSRWTSHAPTTQTGCAVALMFRLVPDSERSEVGDALASLVREADGRVATGFLGTPLVLPALAAAGRFEEAYLMLLRRDVPSWLYQVDQGATTVWERWDAIRPDGSIHPGSMTTPPSVPSSADREPHMLSFNHYAFGAVIDWVYRHVAGLAPDPDRPGYRRVLLAPKPAVGIDWARASVDTSYGTVAIDWRLDDAGVLTADIELPFGTEGLLRAPMTDHSEVTIDGRAVDDGAEIGPGRHVVVVTRPRIANAGITTEQTATESAV